MESGLTFTDFMLFSLVLSGLVKLLFKVGVFYLMVGILASQSVYFSYSFINQYVNLFIKL